MILFAELCCHSLSCILLIYARRADAIIMERCADKRRGALSRLSVQRQHSIGPTCCAHADTIGLASSNRYDDSAAPADHARQSK
jgi:hypothetical protein